MKRLLTVILLFLSVLESQAVLKEKDLNNTLNILRTELTTYYRELSHRQNRQQEMENRVGQQMRSVMLQSNQNALMLYSQQQDFIFDLTYACHEATELYQQFQQKQAPF